MYKWLNEYLINDKNSSFEVIEVKDREGKNWFKKIF